MNEEPRSAAAPRRRGIRLLAYGGAVATLFVGFAGFLHTSAGRPLLMTLAGGGCPFGHQALEPAQRDVLRHRGLSALVQAHSDAPARPALGFDLGHAQKSDLVAWAEKHAVSCRAESKGAGLSCTNVPGSVLGEAGQPAGSLSFRFDRNERLVSVLRMVRTPDASIAVALGESERKKLAERMGAPTRATGELSVASLSRGPLRQARAEHRYRDFSAFTSVTNLGQGSYLVTEEAQLVD